MASAFNLTAQLNLRGPNNVNKIVSDIRRQLGTIKGDVDLKINATAARNITQLNATLKTLNISLADTNINARKAADAIALFTQSSASINQTASSTAVNINKASAASAKISSQSRVAAKEIAIVRTEMEEFGRQSALAVRRFAAFSAVTSVIFGLGNAFRQAFGQFIEFDKAFVKLQQVTDKSGSQLQSLSDEVRNLSIGLGVSSSSLIDVAQTLAQAGLSAKETEKALRALALSDLAPSFDSMNDTVEGSIALMRQFGISAGELEKALGSVNAVAAGFAVEASDIIAAIQRTGGVFAAASKGVSEGTDALNEFIAVFTSVRATTRESAETIATGLRTIFTRLQRESTIEALKEFGVTLTDTEGKFVGAYKAVQLLSEGLGRLDPRDIKFSQIVEELGGFRQIGKVIPLIQQFATAQQALKVAQTGQGSLASDAIRAQLSLANQISKVREEFLAFVRDIGSSDTFQTLAKTTLGFASSLIKVASSLKGILPVLAILGISKGGSALTQFGSGFIGGLKKVKPDEKGQSQSLSSSLGSRIGGAIGGSGTDIDFNKLNNSLTSLSNTIDNLITSLGTINGLSSEVANNTASLVSNTASLDALTAVISNINFGGGGTTLNSGGKVLGFQSGGIVPGSGRGDKVPALLEPGEVIINNTAANKYGRENLVRMNKYVGGGEIFKKQIPGALQGMKAAQPIGYNDVSKLKINNSGKGSIRGYFFENFVNKEFGVDAPENKFPDIPNLNAKKGLKERLGLTKSQTGRDFKAAELKYRSGIKPDFDSQYTPENTAVLYAINKNIGGKIQKFVTGGKALGTRSKFKELSQEEIFKLSTPDLIAYGKALAEDIFTTSGAGMATNSEFIEVPADRIVPELESNLVSYMGKKGFWREKISPFGRPVISSTKQSTKVDRQAALEAQVSKQSDEVAARNQQWSQIKSGSNIDNYLLSKLQDPILSDYKTVRDGGSLSKQFHNTRLRKAVNEILESYDDFDYSATNIDKLVSGMAAERFSNGGLIQKFMAGSVGVQGVQPSININAQTILDKLEDAGGPRRARELLTIATIEKAISKVQTSGKRPRSASDVFDKRFLTSQDAIPFLPTLSKLADEAIAKYSGTGAADFDLTPEQIAAARDVAIAGLRSDMKDLQPYYRVRKGFPLRVHTGIINPDKYIIIDKLLEKQHQAQVEAARAFAPNETINPLSKEERVKFGEDNLGGYNLESLLALFGSGNGKKTTQDAIDFANGLTPLAAGIFGVPPGIPTQAKLTVSSSNVTKALDGIIKTFAFGGPAEGPSFDEVRKKIMDKYPEIDFRISKRKRGFGYMIQGGLSPDNRSQVNFASNLKELSTASDKMAQDILYNYGPHIDSTLLKKLQKKKQFAIGGSIQQLSGGGTVPAMVSNGEAYVSPETAKKIGYAKLNRMNQADRNGMKGFAGGGISVFKGSGSGTSDSIGPVSLPVGSYVIREKATKALGLNKGGSVGVQKFAVGGSPDDIVAPDLLLDRSAISDFRNMLLSAAANAGKSLEDMAKEIKKAGEEARKAATASGKNKAQANQAAREAMGSRLGLTTVTKSDARIIEETNAGAPRPVIQKVDASARSLDIVDRKARKESYMAQKRTKTGVTGGTRKEYFDAGVVRTDFDQNSGRDLKPDQFGPAQAPRTQIASKTMDDQLQVATSVIAKEVKAKWNQLYNEEKQALAQYYQERMKNAKTSQEQTQVAADFLQAKSSLKQDYTTRAQTEFESRKAETKRGIQTERQSVLDDRASRRDPSAIIDKDAIQKAKEASEAQVSASDSWNVVKTRAKQAGLSVNAYTNSLRQQIIETSKNKQKQSVQNVENLRIDSISKRKSLGDEGVSGQTAAKDIRESLQAAIGNSVSEKDFDKIAEAYISGLQDLSKTTDEVINSIPGLSTALQNSTTDQQAYQQTLQSLSQATGIAEETLKQFADETDAASSRAMEALGNTASRISQWGGRIGLVISGLSSAASEAIKNFNGQDNRGGAVAAAGLASFGTTAGAGIASLAQIPSAAKSTIDSLSQMGGGVGKIASSIGPKLMTALTNPITAGFAIAGAAALGVAAAMKDAHNAAREFDKALAARNVENSLEKVANAFNEFEKDIKNLTLLDTIKTELTFAGQNVAKGIRIDAEVPKAMWTNLFDALGTGDQASAERSQILERKGFGDYMSASAFGQNPLGMVLNATLLGIPDAIAQAATGESMFQGSMKQADKNRNNIMASMSPQMAKEQSAQFKLVADQTLRLFESKLKTGTSMEDVMKELKDASGAPTQLAENIARSNPVIQEQILRIRASNVLGAEEKRVAEQNIVAKEAEYRTTLELNNVLRQLEMDKLDKAMKGLVASLERMFNDMDQAISKSTFELDSLTRSAELTSSALSGQAQAGTVSLKSINVLQNQRAYSSPEVDMAVTQGADVFGSQSKTIAPLLTLGNKLEDTVLSTINRVRKESPEASDEKVATNIRFELDRALNGLGLPSNITDKLSKEVGRAFSDITAKGDKDLSFDEIVEKVPAFAKAIDSSRRAQEMAAKALEFWQKNLNDYAQAMNTNVDLQMEANSQMRKAASLQYQGQLELKKTLEQSVSLNEVRKGVNMGISSQTGGLTDPRDIGRNINRLEETRKSQQALSDSAANRGQSGRNEFMVMQNNLSKTNLALRENYAALKQLADSGELAGAALAKINEVQQQRQAGANVIEKLVTSNPEELNNFRNAMSRLQNNMQGNMNAGSTAEQRSESLQAFNMIAPMLGDQQGAMKANVLESMLKESGVGVDPMMQDVLNSLRNPEGDPQMAQAISVYQEGVNQQVEANKKLAVLNQTIAENNADIAAKKLTDAISNVKLSFESQTLNSINSGIQALVNIAQGKGGVPGVAEPKRKGGIVYASAGELINFQPQGTDTVPAMLTPGEFVVNRAATQKHLPLLKNINSGKYSKGGSVRYYQDGGLVSYWTKNGGWSADTKSTTGDGSGGTQKNRELASGEQSDENMLTSDRSFLQLKKLSDVENLKFAFSATKSLVSLPAAVFAEGKSSELSPWNKTSTDIPNITGSFNSIPGYGYEKVKVQTAPSILDTMSYSTDKKGKSTKQQNTRYSIETDPVNPIAAFKSKINYNVGRIPSIESFKNIIKMNGNNIEVGPIKKTDVDQYNKLIKLILSDWRDAKTPFVIDKVGKVSQPPKLNVDPQLKIVGSQYELSGLSAIDSNNSSIITTSDAFKGVLDRNQSGSEGNIVGFQQGGTFGTYTKVVSGADNMGNYGKILKQRVFPLRDLDYELVTQMSQESAAISSLYNILKANEKDIEKYTNQSSANLYVESEELSSAKSGMADLDALFQKRIFKASFNKDAPLSNGNISDWPVTLYNIAENDWVKNTVPKLKAAIPGGAGKSYAESTDQLINLQPYNIDKNQFVADGRDFPWVSAQTAAWLENQGALAAAQSSFDANNTGPIKQTAASYKDNRYEFGYSSIEAPFFDPAARNLGELSNKYIAISSAPGSEATNPFAGIPSGKVLYAQTIESVIDLLNRSMPPGDEILKKVEQGETISPFTVPLKASENIGLSFIPEDIKQQFKSTSIGQSLDDGKLEYLISGSGTTPTLEDYTLTLDQYTKARIDRIKNRDFNDIKARTETAQGFDKLTDVEETFPEMVRIGIAQAAAELASMDFSSLNLPISLDNPRTIAQVGGFASGIYGILPKFDNKSPEWIALDAWRGVFSGLYKPGDADARYYKSFGVNLNSFQEAYQSALTALPNLIAREKAIIFTANNQTSGALTEDQLKQTGQMAKEGQKLYSVGPDGKKTEISPEARKSPKNVADIEKIALTPENIFGSVDERQTYLDILSDWYTNKSGLPADFSEALNTLKTWYKAQDFLLNTSLTPDILSSNIARVEEDEIIQSRDQYQPSQLLLTGNRYGELPTPEKLKDLIKVRADEKAKEPEKTQTSNSNDINTYARGGLVYASSGQYINFQPKGTDTVPAMLTPGEFVINRQSTAKYKPVLEAINSGNYNTGGIVRYLNNGGLVFPNYYRDGGTNSSSSAAFDFASFMQNLAGKLISTIPEAIKQALQNSTSGSQTSSNGVSSIDSNVLDQLNQFTNRLKSVTDTLANLQAIPSEIKVTGRHDVNVIINGDSALNQLKPELQNLVTSEISKALDALAQANKTPGAPLVNPFKP